MSSPETTTTTLSPEDLKVEHDTLLEMINAEPLSPEDTQAAIELSQDNRDRYALSREGARHALTATVGNRPLSSEIEPSRTSPLAGALGNVDDNWRNTGEK